MNIKKLLLISLSLLVLNACNDNIEAATDSHGHDEKATSKHDDDEHGKEKAGGHGDEHGGEESGTVDLTSEQMNAANIEVTTLSLQAISETISAPGEVKLNDYKTVKITPRIDAQVIKRHAILGEIVTKGQALITLSSVDMAEVQGNLLVATREWNRVKKLGRKVVSERRYTEARANWNQLLTKARSYGMTQTEMDSLINKSNKKIADGTFKLFAPQAGRILISITDESVMWVEARLNATQAEMISEGNSAEVILGKQKLPAKVTQVHHVLDETTRTLSVRLEVKNDVDHLHSGMFVTANIAVNKKFQALVIPEEAVLRSADGDWQVFIEADKAGEFKAQEIELVKIINGNAIIEGITPGTKVVTKGAFFVQSEIAKGGFEIHNH